MIHLLKLILANPLGLAWVVWQCRSEPTYYLMMFRGRLQIQMSDMLYSADFGKGSSWTAVHTHNTEISCVSIPMVLVLDGDDEPN